MHVIAKHQTAVTLFGVDGYVRAFKSIAAARRELGLSWIANNVGPDFVVYRYTTAPRLGNPERGYAQHSFVMRDEFGAKLIAADCRIDPRRRSPFRIRALDSWNGAGPVPGVHRSGGGYRYFRAISTHQERREACLVVNEDGEVPPRAARGTKRLPTSWGDFSRSTTGARSWKRFRRTQWR